ncbi:hypothetical protein AVEN_61328-1 [Araneus ventricosus]|uniref:Uncharacterized protein n=1 Tax=Araneus ventricosus TaxID=182803 RepID=A0A4Y2U7E9_ARAVE|nr:hypothetical protein AVEN_61328-1 [Araneus ventricosus]
MLHLSRSCGCGLVVKSRLCRRSVPGSKPDSTEDSPSMWICFPLNQTLWVKRPPAGVFLMMLSMRGESSSSHHEAALALNTFPTVSSPSNNWAKTIQRHLSSPNRIVHLNVQTSYHNGTHNLIRLCPE